MTIVCPAVLTVTIVADVSFGSEKKRSSEFREEGYKTSPLSLRST